jgi:hypothetical protein
MGNWNIWSIDIWTYHLRFNCTRSVSLSKRHLNKHCYNCHLHRKQKKDEVTCERLH